MFIDYIELCQTTPLEEPCMQLGENDYQHYSRLEAIAYIDQLKRTIGINPTGTKFSIVKCPHDFGIYHDIRFRFDEQDDNHVHYMSQIEKGLDHWDEIAIKFLLDNGYPKQTKIIPLRATA